MRVQLSVLDEAREGAATPSLAPALAPGLPPGSLRAARALASALFATEEGAPPADRLDWLERELGDFFAHAGVRARWLFRLCVLALGVLAPLLILRAPGLARLSLEDRIEALHRAERTPLSLPLLAAKAILSICYYEHPDASASIGWDQDCMGPPR